MVVLISEKDIIPPPPYLAVEQVDSHAFSGDFESSTVSESPDVDSNGDVISTRRLRSSTAPSLPSHVLLLIVYGTLPMPGEIRRGRRESVEECAVRTTRTLYWMAFCLRCVNRGFYLASMHLLRSTFLVHYAQHIRSPYSSEPFPHSSNGTHGGIRAPVVSSLQTESQVLDLYILHRLHEDVFSADSSLHTARTDVLGDLFDFMQPRGRLADLVRAYGSAASLSSPDVGVEHRVEECGRDASETEPTLHRESAEVVGQTRPLLRSFPSSSTLRSTRQSSAPNDAYHTSVSGLKLKAQLARSSSSLTLAQQFTVPSPPSAHLPSATHEPRTVRVQRVPLSALRVAFSPRRIGLVYAPVSSVSGPRGGPRTIVDLPRARDEPLERCASRLLAGLKAWLDSEGAIASSR
ncbi:hypothetical protein M0805_006214 [Coniferiporia weirii]|nr:hypothetical protein M0805_006214 [Coniferiporia weirii]